MLQEINLEDVKEDPRLTTEEKESTFTINKENDLVDVFCSESAMIKRLLQHPKFTLTFINKYNGNICSIKGHFPINIMSIGKKGRSNDYHSSVVTNSVTTVEENCNVELK